MIVINVAPEKPKQRRPRFQTSNGGNAGRGLSNLSTSTLQGELLRESLTGLRDRNMMPRNQTLVTDRRDNFDVADTLGGNNFIAQGNPTSFYEPTDNPSIRATPNYLVEPESDDMPPRLVRQVTIEPEPEPEPIIRQRDDISNYNDLIERLIDESVIYSSDLSNTEKQQFRQLYNLKTGKSIRKVTNRKIMELQRNLSGL
jgi:hypothetical protein